MTRRNFVTLLGLIGLLPKAFANENSDIAVRMTDKRDAETRVRVIDNESSECVSDQIKLLAFGADFREKLKRRIHHWKTLGWIVTSSEHHHFIAVNNQYGTATMMRAKE